MKVKDIVLISASTFLIIIGAYISVPVGPVPIVLTNFFIILIGLLLGWKKALLAVVTYILLGIIGLPVFSNGRGGMAHFLGMTGGFLIGFVILGFISGLSQGKNIALKICLVLSGSILVYIIGVPWAMYVYNTVIAPGGDKPLWDIATTLKYTAIPYFFPDLIKIVAALAITRVLEPVVKPFIGRNE